MGYVKLVATIVKYLPQMMKNYRRQSTSGWSIEQIILGLVGGIFSIAQLLIDCSLQNDWSGVKGNIIKLALGNISLFFDSVRLSSGFDIVKMMLMIKPRFSLYSITFYTPTTRSQIA